MLNEVKNNNRTSEKVLSQELIKTKPQCKEIFIFGSIAAATAKTVIAPLDRTKIIIQTSSQEFTFKRIFCILKSTINVLGYKGLWKGHSANLARVIPYGGIQFLTFDTMKKLYLSSKKSSHDSESLVYLDPSERLFCGCVTGLVSTGLTYPLDLIRTRMAITEYDAFRSMNRTIRITVKKEGIFGLYRGLGVSLVGILPYAGVSFFTFETLKTHFLNGRKDQHGVSQQNLTTIERLVCGGLAGLIAQSVSYPFDVVRRLLQFDCCVLKNEYRFLRTIHVIRYVLYSQGIVNGFYKGLSINWIKGPIASATSFTVFETLKQRYCVP